MPDISAVASTPTARSRAAFERSSMSQTWNWTMSGRESPKTPTYKKMRLSRAERNRLTQSSSEDELDCQVRAAFGEDFELKPFQRQAITTIQQGRNAFVVAGTGSGKSICFQALALRPNAVVLVVSPLIRLETEQVLFFL